MYLARCKRQFLNAFSRLNNTPVTSRSLSEHTNPPLNLDHAFQALLQSQDITLQEGKERASKPSKHLEAAGIVGEVVTPLADAGDPAGQAQGVRARDEKAEEDISVRVGGDGCVDEDRGFVGRGVGFVVGDAVEGEPVRGRRCGSGGGVRVRAGRP